LGLLRIIGSIKTKKVKGAFGWTFGQSLWENAKVFELKEFFKMQIAFGKL